MGKLSMCVMWFFVTYGRSDHTSSQHVICKPVFGSWRGSTCIPWVMEVTPWDSLILAPADSVEFQAAFYIHFCARLVFNWIFWLEIWLSTFSLILTLGKLSWFPQVIPFLLMVQHTMSTSGSEFLNPVSMTGQSPLGIQSYLLHQGSWNLNSLPEQCYNPGSVDTLPRGPRPPSAPPVASCFRLLESSLPGFECLCDIQEGGLPQLSQLAILTRSLKDLCQLRGIDCWAMFSPQPLTGHLSSFPSLHLSPIRAIKGLCSKTKNHNRVTKAEAYLRDSCKRESTMQVSKLCYTQWTLVLVSSVCPSNRRC